MSLQEALLAYDWRRPESALAIKGYGDDVARLITDPAELGVIERFRLGTYLQHHLRDSDNAVKILDTVVKKPDGLDENMLAWAKNNLAFAVVNSSIKSNKGVLNKIEKLLEPLTRHENVEISSFATRIKGQVYFARAAVQESLKDAYKHVIFGIDLCKQGTEKLNPEIPEQLSEIARTYNRNALEILKLAQRFQGDNIMPCLQPGIDQSVYACMLWDAYSKETEFSEYKGRARRTLGELYIEQYKASGDKEYLGMARKQLGIALEKLTKTEEQAEVKKLIETHIQPEPSV